MPQLPSEFLSVILPYADLFCKRIFVHVQLLVAGAILAPGKRTVSSVLRIVGLSQQKAFHKYHRVLSQAQWSAHQASRLLLTQLMELFLGDEPLVVGIDETLERRWGKRIETRGIYRDAVRSSDSHFVKCSGLRWMCVMMLTKVIGPPKRLGQPDLGTSFFDGLSAIRTLLRRQSSSSQKTHRLGASTPVATQTMVASTSADCCWG